MLFPFILFCLSGLVIVGVFIEHEAFVRGGRRLVFKRLQLVLDVPLRDLYHSIESKFAPEFFLKAQKSFYALLLVIYGKGIAFFEYSKRKINHTLFDLRKKHTEIKRHAVASGYIEALKQEKSQRKTTFVEMTPVQATATPVEKVILTENIVKEPVKRTRKPKKNTEQSVVDSDAAPKMRTTANSQVIVEQEASTRITGDDVIESWVEKHK
jgi:hypothetical protein